MSAYSTTQSSASSSEDDIFRVSAGNERDSVQWHSSDSDAVQHGSGTEQGTQEIDQIVHEKVKRYYRGSHKARPGRKTREKSRLTIAVKDEAPVYPEDDPPKAVADVATKPNHMYKNILIYVILGYISGIFLVLLWYLFHYQKAGSDLNAKWWFIVLLVLLLLIISYSRSTRCIGVLLLPTLGTLKGRALLIAFALFLAVMGPMMNIIRNIEIMSHSLACGQMLLKQALTPMHEIMGEPVHVIEQSVYVCLSQVRQLMERLDGVLQRLEASIDRIHADYKSCDNWLQHQQNFFDNQMGTPLDRCLGAGSIGVQECQSKFGSKNSVCHIGKTFEWFCSNLKDLASFFDPDLQQQQKLAEQIFNRPMDSFAKIRSIFEVSITFDHSQKTDKEQGTLSSDLDLEFGKHFDLQLQHFLLTFVWLNIVVCMLIIFVILGSIYFRINYMGCNNFKNYYLNNKFVAYNSHQQKNYGYSALPLRATERPKYVKLRSLRMLYFELRVMRRSLVFMIIISLQLFTICFVDYSLFWYLAMMSYHSHQTAELQPPEYTKIVIKNGGLIGYILQGLVQAFEPMSKNLIVDIQRCLPLPVPPKYLRYWEIMMLCILAWCLLLCEPFCRRLRHCIMSGFYSDYAEKRAQYLHRRIMLNREIFIKSARRRARALNAYSVENWICNSLCYFRSFMNWITSGHSGAYKGKYCVICNSPLTSKDYVSCDTNGCRGVYCQTCFIESNCHCILCSSRTSYGDFSDISEVEDSSDDPEAQPFRPDDINCSHAHHDAAAERRKSA